METSLTAATALPAAASRAGKYLSFYLSREQYAIQVLKVREIMGIQQITAVPQTPPDVKGVMNLRGKVIPVVDLRLKLGLPERPYDEKTCMIVVEPQGEIATQMAIVVDEVSDILNLAETDIADTRDANRGLETRYLLGIAKVRGRVKILLDIDEMLTWQNLGGLAAIFEKNPQAIGMQP